MSLLQISWELLRDSFLAWLEDGCGQLGAAIAFYTIISLAPLLIVVIMVAGFFFGDDAARSEIVLQIDGLVGKEGAEAVQQMLIRADQPTTGWLASLIGLGALIFGATTVFYQLRQALNRIWGTLQEPYNAVTAIVRARLIALVTVLGVGFLLLVSLVISAGIAAITEYTQVALVGAEFILRLLNFVISLGYATLLFALTFRILPNQNLKWKFAFIGGFFTACLFTLGKFLIGWYLGQRSIGSVYGAAGSVVVILIWVYYSAQIMLLGAEFTKVYHRRYGKQMGETKLMEKPEDAEILIETR